MVYKQCLESVKQTPEYKARLKKFKEEKVVEMEKQGLIKKKLNGKRCALHFVSCRLDRLCA